jgi:hypothetical protein
MSYSDGANGIDQGKETKKVLLGQAAYVDRASKKQKLEAKDDSSSGSADSGSQFCGTPQQHGLNGPGNGVLLSGNPSMPKIISNWYEKCFSLLDDSKPSSKILPLHCGSGPERIEPTAGKDARSLHKQYFADKPDERAKKLLLYAKARVEIGASETEELTVTAKSTFAHSLPLDSPPSEEESDPAVFFEALLQAISSGFLLRLDRNKYALNISVTTAHRSERSDGTPFEALEQFRRDSVAFDKPLTSQQARSYGFIIWERVFRTAEMCNFAEEYLQLVCRKLGYSLATSLDGQGGVKYNPALKKAGLREPFVLQVGVVSLVDLACLSIKCQLRKKVFFPGCHADWSQVRRLGESGELATLLGEAYDAVRKWLLQGNVVEGGKGRAKFEASTPEEKREHWDEVFFDLEPQGLVGGATTPAEREREVRSYYARKAAITRFQRDAAKTLRGELTSHQEGSMTQSNTHFGFDVAHALASTNVAGVLTLASEHVKGYMQSMMWKFPYEETSGVMTTCSHPGFNNGANYSSLKIAYKAQIAREAQLTEFYQERAPLMLT